MSVDPTPRRETERFEVSRGRLRVYSERWPIKYLVSNDGICLGVDTKRRSFLLLAYRDGILFRERPVGDTVVEDLNYEIPAIVRAVRPSSEMASAGVIR